MNWFVWRPVAEQWATYTEVMHRWTLQDLMDCHRALNEVAKARKEQSEAR